MRKQNSGFTFTHFLVVMIVVGLGSMFWRWATEDARAAKEARWDILFIQPMLQEPKVAVFNYLMQRRKFPADNRAASVAAPEKFADHRIASVEIESGAIHVTFARDKVAPSPGKVFTLRPSIDDYNAAFSKITWVCGYAEADMDKIVGGVNRTTIEREFLPENCKGPALENVAGR